MTMLLTLSACSSMLLGDGSSSNSQLGVDNRSSDQISADNAISATIRSRYGADTTLAEAGLAVRTETYVVTVSGQVNEFADRDRAVRIARNTDGVRSVNNQISVNTRQ